MATSLYMYVISLLLYFAVDVQAQARKEMTACNGADAVLDFEKSSAKKAIFTRWVYKKKKTGENETAIAESHESQIIFGPYKSRVVIEGDLITLKKISTTDSGVYLRRVQDSSNGQELFQDTIHILVSEPPSSPPKVIEKRNKDNKLMLTCSPPTSLGYPEAKTVLMDSAGVIQDNLTITVNDYKYRCCLIGDSAKCMKTPRCAIYEVEGKQCQECWTATICSWLGSAAALIILQSIYLFVFQTHEQPNEQSQSKCYVFKRFWKRASYVLGPGCIFSLAIMLTVSTILCIERKNCLLPTVFFVIIGLGCSFTMVIPQLAITLLISNNTETKKEKLMEKVESAVITPEKWTQNTDDFVRRIKEKLMEEVESAVIIPEKWTQNTDDFVRRITKEIMEKSLAEQLRPIVYQNEAPENIDKHNEGITDIKDEREVVGSSRVNTEAQMSRMQSRKNTEIQIPSMEGPPCLDEIRLSEGDIVTPTFFQDEDKPLLPIESQDNNVDNLQAEET